MQAHSVLNTNFLKVALIQHTFTCALPMPKPEGEGVGAVLSERACLWRTPMLYAQQLDLMLLLQRIAEHFAASVFCLDHTRLNLQATSYELHVTGYKLRVTSYKLQVTR